MTRHVLRLLKAACVAVPFLSQGMAAPLAVPLPSSPLPPDRTAVWTPLLPATWNELKNETGGLLSVDPPNPVINGLEEFRFDPAATFPADSWKTWSGPATPEFVARVNAEATAITGEEQGSFRIADPDPLRKIAFGLIDHRLEFSHPFHRSKLVPLKFKAAGQETDVSFFGARGKHHSVDVLAWDPTHRSHATRLFGKQDESVILYLPPAGKDIATAWSEVREMLAGTRTHENPLYPFDGKDELRVPYLDLSTETDLTSHFQGTLKFERYGPVPEVRTTQVTRFRLDEKGAHVRVDTRMDPFAGPSPEPRRLIYDRPFFVFLWKNNSGWPYFAAWIGATDAMEPFKTAE